MIVMKMLFAITHTVRTRVNVSKVILEMEKRVACELVTTIAITVIAWGNLNTYATVIWAGLAPTVPSIAAVITIQHVKPE